MEKLKVFVSDDSTTVRERLVTMALDLPDVDVVGQAQDAPGTLKAIRQTRPDVVILDIRMPGAVESGKIRTGQGRAPRCV